MTALNKWGDLLDVSGTGNISTPSLADSTPDLSGLPYPRWHASLAVER
jgi:hypothetical protein